MWVCEKCHSLNRKNADLCYACRAPAPPPATGPIVAFGERPPQPDAQPSAEALPVDQAKASAPAAEPVASVAAVAPVSHAREIPAPPPPPVAAPAPEPDYGPGRCPLCNSSSIAKKKRSVNRKTGKPSGAGFIRVFEWLVFAAFAGISIPMGLVFLQRDSAMNSIASLGILAFTLGGGVIAACTCVFTLVRFVRTDRVAFFDFECKACHDKWRLDDGALA